MNEPNIERGLPGVCEVCGNMSATVFRFDLRSRALRVCPPCVPAFYQQVAAALVSLMPESKRRNLADLFAPKPACPACEDAPAGAGRVRCPTCGVGFRPLDPPLK